jgi:hypothetical protein
LPGQSAQVQLKLTPVPAEIVTIRLIPPVSGSVSIVGGNSAQVAAGQDTVNVTILAVAATIGPVSIRFESLVSSDLVFNGRAVSVTIQVSGSYETRLFS